MALPFLQYRWPLLATADGFYLGVRINKGHLGYHGPTDPTLILTINDVYPVEIGDFERAKHDPDGDAIAPKVEVTFNDAWTFNAGLMATDGISNGTGDFRSASGVLHRATPGSTIVIDCEQYKVTDKVSDTEVLVTPPIPAGINITYKLVIFYDLGASQSSLMQEVFSDYTLPYELWLDCWTASGVLDEVWFMGDVDPNSIPKQHILVQNEFTPGAMRLAEYKITANFLIERLSAKIKDGVQTGTINDFLGNRADGWLNLIPSSGNQVGSVMYAGVAANPDYQQQYLNGYYILNAVRYLWTESTPPPNNQPGSSYRVCTIKLKQILDGIATYAGFSSASFDSHKQFRHYYQQWNNSRYCYDTIELSGSNVWDDIYVNANFLFGTSIPAPSDPNSPGDPAIFKADDGVTSTSGTADIFTTAGSAPFTIDCVGSTILIGATFGTFVRITEFINSNTIRVDTPFTSDATDVHYELPLAWVHGIPAAWPITIGRDASVLTLLSWLCLQTGCFVDYDIDTSGNVSLTLKARRAVADTSLDYVILESSGEDPKLVPQSGVIIQCLGDDLQALAGPNPKDAKTLTLPWRVHKYGSPLPSSHEFAGAQHPPDNTELWWDKSSKNIFDQALSVTCDLKDPNGKNDFGYRSSVTNKPTDRGWVGASMLYYCGNANIVLDYRHISDCPTSGDANIFYALAAVTPADIPVPTDEQFGGYFNPQWAYAQFYYQELVGNRILLTQNFTGYRGAGGKIQSLRPGLQMQTYIQGAYRTFNAHSVKVNPYHNKSTIQWIEVIDYAANLPAVNQTWGNGSTGGSSSSSTSSSTAAGTGSSSSPGRYLYQNPASADVNTITPTGDFVGLTHKAVSAQTADFEQWTTNNSIVVARLSKDGALTIHPAADVVPYTGITRIGSSTDLIHLGNTNVGTLFYVNSDGKAFAAGGLDAGSHKITNLANGTAPTDAATVGQLPTTGTGTVTSVDVDGGSSGLTFSGGPVTTAGVISLSGGYLHADYGGTGQSTYNDGDLLVGTPSGGLTTVSLGGTGQVLTAAPGAIPPFYSVQWQDLPVLYAYSGAGLVGGSGTNYFHPNGYSAGVGTLQVQTEAIQTRNGKARNLFVQLDAPPGPGQSVTVTVYLNGVSTLLSASLSGAGVIASNDTIHTLNLNAGDRLTIEVQNTFGALTTQAAWGFELV